MYRRLIILSIIILVALCGLTWLGYRAIQIQAKGMEGARLGEFAAVAEQIRQDVKRKLDEFIQREQNRPYTDYQYYYVPENVAPTRQPAIGGPLLRSPLGFQMENDLAYGNFQIEPDGTIVTPYYRKEQADSISGQSGQQDELARKADAHLDNIKKNLLPVLRSTRGIFTVPVTSERLHVSLDEKKEPDNKLTSIDSFGDKIERKQLAKARGGRWKEYPIESLQKESQKTQIIIQPRSFVTSNVAQSVEVDRVQSQQTEGIVESESGGLAQLSRPNQIVKKPPSRARMTSESPVVVQQESQGTGKSQKQGELEVTDRTQLSFQEKPQQEQSDTVQIKIEPFVPIVVPSDGTDQSIFGGQIFLLRLVQIGDPPKAGSNLSSPSGWHLIQGFKLNEDKLVEQVKESAQRFMRKGMIYELLQTKTSDRTADNARGAIAYTAILDFGFGELLLNLKEIDPFWIAKQISQLKYWYFSIITIVFLAVTLSVASLWHNIRAQVKLAQKKDDFISAVSHELRTPLTSIRLYSEMLEKNWVKSKDKLAEYYRSMRQESERLSRLIENVLDFSRIQNGRKKYTFSLGDINKCVAEVVEMMRPYAQQYGFSIKMDLTRLGQSAFDADAVTQIVVNLLDNAIKYARTADDKIIIVRTKSQGLYTVIEVEDHGPGISRRQRSKVFEQFYRSETEAEYREHKPSGIQTTGTGLGLTLVKKFAEAHNGFVEIISAKPKGTIFRVALASRI